MGDWWVVKMPEEDLFDGDEETLEAIVEWIKRGRALYIGGKGYPPTHIAVNYPTQIMVE